MADAVKSLTIDLGMTNTAALQAAQNLRQELKQTHQGILADAVEAEKAKAEAIKRATAEVVQDAAKAQKVTTDNVKTAAGQQTEAVKAAASAQSHAIKETAQAQSQVQSSIDSVISKYSGMAVAAMAVKTIGDAWKDVIEKEREAALKFHQAVKEARVGAGVKGVSAEQYAAETTKLSAMSGLSFGEADQMTREFEGSLPIGLQKGNITRKVADELLQQGAISGARLGGDQGVRGELLGILAQFGKIDSAKQGMGQAEAIRQALTAGRGDDSALTKALLNVSGSMVSEGGMVGSLAENAALVGTTSLSGGAGMADTRAMQIARATKGTTKDEMQKLEDQFGIKVGSKMGLEDRLKLIVPKLREISKTEDASSWLTRNIGTSQENAQALLEMMPNFEVFQERMKMAREASTGGGDSVLAENAKFMNSAGGKRMLAGAKIEAGKVVQGNQNKDFDALVAQQQALLEANGPSVGASVQNKMFQGASYLFPGLGGNSAEAYALDDLDAMASDKGVNTPYSGFFGQVKGLFASPATKGKAYVDALRSAGQDPYDSTGGGGNALDATLAPKLDGLIAETKKTNQILAAPPPVPLKDPIPPTVRAK